MHHPRVVNAHQPKSETICLVPLQRQLQLIKTPGATRVLAAPDSDKDVGFVDAFPNFSR
jgi:hypothetical protein